MSYFLTLQLGQAASCSKRSRRLEAKTRWQKEFPPAAGEVGFGECGPHLEDGQGLAPSFQATAEPQGQGHHSSAPSWGLPPPVRSLEQIQTGRVWGWKVGTGSETDSEAQWLVDGRGGRGRRQGDGGAWCFLWAQQEGASPQDNDGGAEGVERGDSEPWWGHVGLKVVMASPSL